MKFRILEIRSLIRTTLLESQRAAEIEKLAASVGKYVHFSDSDRAGISYNKDVHPGNPRGFYGYPLTPSKLNSMLKGDRDAFDEYGHRKYIYVFDVKGRVLDLESFDLVEEFKKLYDWAKHQPEIMKTMMTWLEVKDFEQALPTWTLLKFMRDVIGHMTRAHMMKNEASAMNFLFRQVLHYDAVVTTNEGMRDDIRSQIIVLTPTAIKILHKIDNPMGLTKQEIEEDEKEMAALRAAREERQKKDEIEQERLHVYFAKARKDEDDRLQAKAEWDARYLSRKRTYL